MFSMFSKTDVLAVRYVNDLICIGLGSALYIVNKLNHELQTKLDVLYPERIHGIIEAAENKLIIFGGKSLRICKLDITNNSIKIHFISNIYHFSDWIIAAECVSVENEEKLIILFAHNNLYICNLFETQYYVVQCQEKCILYAGSIFSKDYDAVVFSGTVFQEILIWKTNTKKSNGHSPILHRLKGHDGVIFSVFYDPLTNLICSTSDDRTVRLWSIVDEKENVPQRRNVEWENVTITLIATMYGHTARVWRAMIRNDIIISIGEDSQICLWSIKGQFLKKIQAHHGAPIWSVDISRDNRMMLTGAADGAVYAWPFPFNFELDEHTLSENCDDRTPKFVCHLSSGRFLVIKDGGEINYLDLITHHQIESFSLPNFSTYLLMQVSPDKRRISLASKDGFITIYQELINEKETQLEWQVTEKIIDSKIFSIQWLSDNALLVCGSLGQLYIVSVASNGAMKILSEYALPESRERWITAATMYKTLLICGDRAGSIFVYKISRSMDKNSPVQTFYKIYGRFGIQFCLIRGTKLITAGRDGQMRYFNLRNDNSEYFLELECAKNMPMDWISKVLETRNDLYVFGFGEIDFIVYSMNLRRILVRIPCGGGHRSWDCLISEGILRFVFIRNKKVHLITFPLHKLALPPVVEGYHTKEIHCMQMLKTLRNSWILISSSEDCSIRISCVVKSTSGGGMSDFKTLDILDGHISNVKSLAILNIENTESCSKNLVFSGGGRAQLNVWQLVLRLGEREISNEDLSCKLFDSFMLRGTDKERKKMIKALKVTYDINPETRYMDINVHSCLEGSNLVLLFIACSDGYIRTFSYNVNNFKLKYEYSLQYGRCILKVHSFKYHNNLILLTMATDGVINFWNFNCILGKIHENEKSENMILAPFTKVHVHQSGINSFDLKKINDNEYLLATGGDDNLLSLIVFSFIDTQNRDLSARILARWSSSNSHSAQITGVKFYGRNKLYSVGTDQKVIVHKYLCECSKLSVSKENETITCVSDVQGITLCGSYEHDDTLLCTFGKGLEFIIDNE